MTKEDESKFINIKWNTTLVTKMGDMLGINDLKVQFTVGEPNMIKVELYIADGNWFRRNKI